MTALIPPVQVVHTTCTLDCPDTCSLAVTVTDGRITDIDAAPGNPLTGGWICAKVKRHAERVYAPERVITPLVRTGPKGSGEMRPAAWDEVLELIADRTRAALAAGGADAVVAYTYNSSTGVTESASHTEALFAALGATRVEHTICAATMSAAWDSVYGDMRSADPLDVVNAELVVIWGANPTVSNTHFPPLVHQAVARGAKLVVIDPRRTAMAKRADLHLAVRPGTDVVLALAIANHWRLNGHLDKAFVADHADSTDVAELLVASEVWSFESAAAVTGLDPADIVTLAEWWGTTKASMLRIGWGQERNANGGAACRAILALPVLGGHFGRPGSGVIGSTSSRAIHATRRWPSIEHRPRRSLAMHQVGQWLAPGAGDPCRILFVQGANPVLMCPDQHAVRTAFARDDVFTVVHDQVLTDTTRYADVVLPATTAFEISDVTASYGSYTVQPVRPVIERVGLSRSNDEVGLDLARSLGFDWPAPPGPEATTDDLGPRVVPVPRQFVDTFPPGGRTRLVDPVQRVPRYEPVAASHPLTLITPASPKLINSMFGEFQSPDVTVTLHPDDAGARSITDGQWVRVHNQHGAVSARAIVSPDVRTGVALMSKGVWRHRYEGGEGVNVLTPATGDALVNGACFNDAHVEVSPA